MAIPTLGDWVKLGVVVYFFAMVIFVFGFGFLWLAAAAALEKGPPWLQRRIFYVRERISKRRVGV